MFQNDSIIIASITETFQNVITTVFLLRLYEIICKTQFSTCQRNVQSKLTDRRTSISCTGSNIIKITSFRLSGHLNVVSKNTSSFQT